MALNKQIDEAKEILEVSKNLICHLELLINQINDNWTHYRKDEAKVFASSSSDGWYRGK